MSISASLSLYVQTGPLISACHWSARTDPSRDIAVDVSPLRALALVAGAAALLLGLTLFIATVVRFARGGRGTLAPWDPPRRLVVEGVYRYVRNPMISGVLFVLLAEVLVMGSGRLLSWLSLFFIINLVYIPLLEEPILEHRFGEQYRLYKRNVPRWVPHRSPWEPPWHEPTGAIRVGYPRLGRNSSGRTAAVIPNWRMRSTQHDDALALR